MKPIHKLNRTSNQLRIALAMLASLGSATAIYGGTEIVPVELVQFWEHGAIVYARVLSVSERDKASDVIVLQPIATLSGNIDSAAVGEIQAPAWFGNLFGVITATRPREGDKVVVLLDSMTDDNGRKSGYRIPNANVRCFPADERPGSQGHHPPIFEVTGFDDPKVTETIENLRKLRGKQREEAEKAAAEKAKLVKPNPAAANPAAK